MASKKAEKKSLEYLCEICDFKCRDKRDYTRHLLTAKHKKAYIGLQEASKKAEKILPSDKMNDDIHKCACGMVYEHRQSLFRHQKRCSEKAKKAEKAEKTEKTEKAENIVHESITDTTLMKCFQTMMEMQMSAQAAVQTAAIEQAAQIQAKRDEAAAEQTKLLIEAITLNGSQTIMNNSNNTTNNQFNLNVFLNEDCKDAFTLKEVMESIECTVSDLDRMDHDGYAATITRKILESMQDMLITERPIHCTDSRRNTVCVKNETGWEKNDKAMKLLVDSVYCVGRKLGGMIQDWQQAYPDHYRGTESRRKQYHRLVDDAMSVIDKSVEAQIANKVCKGIVLDRKIAMDR